MQPGWCLKEGEMLGALAGQFAPAVAAAEEKEQRQSLRVIDERTGKEYTLPIRHNTIGAKSLSQIRVPGNLPLSSFDPGLVNTCIAGSRISFIDGEKGILRYRGYPIEHLAQKASYEEVAFLLLHGELPTPTQLESLRQELAPLAIMPEQIKKLIRSFDRSAHPMSMFVSCLAALSACSPEQNPAVAGARILQHRPTRNRHLMRAIAVGFTIAANIQRHAEGLCFVEPNLDLGLVGSFLHILDDAQPNAIIARALEVLFIVHAEHEMNCSTVAVRHVASSHADLYTSLAAGAAALYGPRHGGANEAAVGMLTRIGSASNVPAFIEKVKRREEKLMGFGHRIYKSYDPRAFIVKQVAGVVFETLGHSALTSVALALERAALKDLYFTSRRLYPNVDFYSGVVYTQLGFKVNAFPLLFAVARLAGWAAHLNEFHQLPPNSEEAKIVRPLQLYRGQGERYETVGRNERKQGVPSDELEIQLTPVERRRHVLAARTHQTAPTWKS
ncbi:hypothetical protein Esti_002320 [Eimeria stiedai]